MLSIEKNMSSQELNSMSLWHEYHENDGRADFEVFYAHTMDNQKLLVKAAKGQVLMDFLRAQV
tara:strand:- start:263 stop:451 length:189 start_codon:yes stop_codon:yes gene_type:complete